MAPSCARRRMVWITGRTGCSGAQGQQAPGARRGLNPRGGHRLLGVDVLPASRAADGEVLRDRRWCDDQVDVVPLQQRLDRPVRRGGPEALATACARSGRTSATPTSAATHLPHLGDAREMHPLGDAAAAGQPDPDPLPRPPSLPDATVAAGLVRLPGGADGPAGSVAGLIHHVEQRLAGAEAAGVLGDQGPADRSKSGPRSATWGVRMALSAFHGVLLGQQLHLVDVDPGAGDGAGAQGWSSASSLVVIPRPMLIKKALRFMRANRRVEQPLGAGRVGDGQDDEVGLRQEASRGLRRCSAVTRAAGPGDARPPPAPASEGGAEAGRLRPDVADADDEGGGPGR